MENDDLFQAQIALEIESRDLTISRYYKNLDNAEENKTAAESDIGVFLTRSYLGTYATAISEFIQAGSAGKAGRRNRAISLFSDVDPKTLAYLALKGLINGMSIRSGHDRTLQTHLTKCATAIGRLVHTEIRLRAFEENNAPMLNKVLKDFDRRELARYKRVDYLHGMLKEHHSEWKAWPESDMLHVGVTLIDLFKETTGDIEVYRHGVGKGVRVCIAPSNDLLELVERRMSHCEALYTMYLPMVVKPRPWGADNLEDGGYLSHHVAHYPLVKASKRGYKRLLRETVGGLSKVLASMNALQETPWRVNTQVLDVLEWAYENNIGAGKLPRADDVVVPEPPAHLEFLPRDHEDCKAFRRQAFLIHEDNRRVVSSRLQIVRAMHLAKKFSTFKSIYFPHDLDSRGRAYPKPICLTPQGPDHVKALLEFADGKPLGEYGAYWLGIHGANSWGEDKVSMSDRCDWATDNIDMIISIANDPKTDLRWTKASSPFQFLAFCFEWSAMWDHTVKGCSIDDFVSHMHVDMDATCSGLQHFSAMLRDEVGGEHVNLVPGLPRRDVYQAVADAAMEIIEKDMEIQTQGLKTAWQSFGIDRTTTKRPVMVKPYAGTFASCSSYVRAAIKDRLAEGEPQPVPKDDMRDFEKYGVSAVWTAIPTVVVAADDAMKWLSTITRLVAKSNPSSKRIEWITPAGLPVHQYKFDMNSKRVKTKFEGSIVYLGLQVATDNLDARKMGTSVAPSFVHSMDAAHLQLTIDRAASEGINHFAAVHDSFGVHAADMTRFSEIIRETFVEMYEGHDVLQEFYDHALPRIDPEFRDKVPAIPPKGSLDLSGVLDSEFFFS